LETVPEEKAVVQLVFDMFLNRNMGYTAISGYLNRNGYTRPPAKNAIRPSYGEWSSDHIKRMFSNPIYTGRVAWGKRRTESYVCSYATKHRGTSVCRRNGVVASQVEDEVMEYTRKIVRNPQFIKDLQEKVMTAVDMTEVENDITAYKNQLSALQRSRDSLERDIDRIAPDDKYAERRRADMTRRLNDLYDQIYKAEDLLQESLMKKATLESEQMSVQSMIGILSSFDAIYDRMNAAERRDLVKYLISEVELFPREEQKTQKRFVKAIAYKFPIEQKVLTQFDECGASVETVCLLSKAVD
jgi:site-specific DNA recombinase